MTGAILLSILAVVCAAAVIGAVLVAQRPSEGWGRWLRDLVRALRREEIGWREPDVPEEDAGGLGALYLMSEPGSAYATPEEIGGQLGTRLVTTVEQRAEAARRAHALRRAERAPA